MPLKKFFIFMIALLVLPWTCLYAAEKNAVPEALPEPLTLELALRLVDQQHPNLRSANADLQISNANLAQVLSNDDLNINFTASARLIEPSVLSANQANDDHRLGLFVGKTLYDFGRSASQVEAASNQVLGQNFHYLNARQQQYLNVMQEYFNVVLADLQFYRYNEEMAVAYIRFDRTQIRAKLGQFTELEVAEKNVEYQRVRRLRTYSENQQRVTRSRLAYALNKPNDLPATVARPELDVVARTLPEFEEIVKVVKENNPLLRALRARLVAAKSNVEFAQAGSRPSIKAGFETFAYTRETASSDKWRASVTLDVPLWSGGRVDSAVAKAKASVYKTEAQLRQQEFSLEQKALELWMGLKTLKVKHDEVLAAMNFSELTLDKNRALYELEVNADLGYSMVKYSEAERKVVQTSFAMALAWAQLDALTGTLLNSKNKI